MKKFKNLTEREQRVILKLLKKQQFLDEIADVDLFCKINKINYEEFWFIHLQPELKEVCKILKC